jgi:formylmethanofuran dehydrogenase subunit A
MYIIDRIESGIAVCESVESNVTFEIAMTAIQKNAKEGDVIKKNGDDFYVIDAAVTKSRKAELTTRLDRLFKKNNS